ncbi:MAG: helix-turn-helix domain-containing protein [Erysipelotrichaceae bacterium]|nr:helix-turn-helix domain-containing protein [Erysipelotrichaceae bacterium]
MSNETNVTEKPKLEKRTYTVVEIAQILDISTHLAYDLVKSGQFAYVRTGRMIRISKPSFDKWLNP